MIDPRKFNEWMKFQAEYTAMLKPELQAEYKKVVDATAEWDKRRNYDQLASNLKQQQDEHKAAVESFQKERDKYTSDMQQWHAGLTKNQAEYDRKMADLASQKADLLAAQSMHENNVKLHKAAIDKRSQELDKREKDLENFQGILHKREVDLSSRHDKVNAAISSLSSLR